MIKYLVFFLLQVPKQMRSSTQKAPRAENIGSIQLISHSSNIICFRFQCGPVCFTVSLTKDFMSSQIAGGGSPMVFSAESNEDCKQISSLETVKEQHGQIWQKDMSTGTREKVCVSISGLQGGQLSAEGLSVKWNSPKGSCRIILECIFPSFLHPKII